MNASRRIQGRAAAPLQMALPWWRVGVVWLVLGGPAAVVVAGVATAAVAWSGADGVIAGADRAQSAVRTASAAAPLPVAGPAAPALTARNHAAAPPKAR